jgi:hypothetical protein
VKRITKAALGGIAGCALILGATQAAIGESKYIVYTWGPEKVTDLRPAEPAGPLDGASASLRIIESPDEGTGFRLRVTGIDSSWEGHDFGAHLHLGLCETLDSTSTHYVDPGDLPFPENEVWFDLVTDDEGVANDETWVQFVPIDKFPSGMSIVIHRDRAALPTIASQKEVCLPVDVNRWQ